MIQGLKKCTSTTEFQNEQKKLELCLYKMYGTLHVLDLEKFHSSKQAEKVMHGSIYMYYQWKIHVEVKFSLLYIKKTAGF